MSLKRYELTPQMRDYDVMKDPGERRYLPYLMYFHRPQFRSEAVNTDVAGFRISHGPGGVTASAGVSVPAGPVRILTGGSTALGVGASSDANTLASLLWRTHAPAMPWLNFGSYCFNPTQEALLFTLYRHALGEVRDIVIVSGINAVMVARFPEWQQGEHGAFFFCSDYYKQMAQLRERDRGSGKRFGRRSARAQTTATIDDLRSDPATVIDAAAQTTIRSLEIWRRMAGSQTRILYVLQPMSRWMNRTLAAQEEVLFEENDRNSELGPWEEVYADLATREFGLAYAAALGRGCEQHGVRFLNLNPVLEEANADRKWLFVDRVHYNDSGHDLVARTIAQELEQS